MTQIPTTADRTMSDEVASLTDRLQKAEAASNADDQAYVLKLLSQLYSRTCQWDAAEDTARKGLAVARKAINRQRLGDALTRLGAVLMDTRSEGAVEPLTEALGIYREIGDQAGQSRCHVNLGIIHQKDGRIAQAVNEYQAASKAARAGNAQDMVGLAELNSGVLLLETGQFMAAAQPLDSALEAFTKAGDKRLMLLTQFNQAHLAREAGDHGRATTIYNDVVTTSATMKMLDVELGALAGRGLSSLAKGDVNAAQADLKTIESKLADRPTWAFQGRELVEALFVRISIAAKETERAVERIVAALPKQRDASAMTWLLADCMPPLSKAGGFIPTSILAAGSSTSSTQGRRISIPGSQPRVTA